MSRMETQLLHFGRALQRLKEAVVELKGHHYRDVVRDGLIHRFEFTYELAWKTTKEYLESIGIVDKNSPKAVIAEAYAQQLFTNEGSWLLMLSDRDQTPHAYDEDLAEEIVQRIVSNYIGEFETLLGNLRK